MAIYAHLGETGIYDIGATNEAARATTPGALYAQIVEVNRQFTDVGFPKTLATTYAIAQMMMESDWMTSNQGNVDNNFSGIKWINKPYQKATRGTSSPEGGYYAHFASFKDWARDFLRILSLNTGKMGRPIDATTAQQYGDRLKANHYDTDPNYASKFNAALKKVNAALAFGAGQDQKFLQQYNNGQTTFTDTAGKGLTSNAAFNSDEFLTTLKAKWAAMSNLEKGGIIAAGVTGVILLVKD